MWWRHPYHLLLMLWSWAQEHLQYWFLLGKTKIGDIISITVVQAEVFKTKHSLELFMCGLRRIFCLYLLLLNLCWNHTLLFCLPFLPLGIQHHLLGFFRYDFSVQVEMVIGYAPSLAFSFGGLIHHISPPLHEKGHTVFLFFIPNRGLLRAGMILPIVEQILGF